MLTVFNLVIATPIIIKKINDKADLKQEVLGQEIMNQRDNKTNIYYLLCDEYASFAQLKADFNFDNNEFRKEVERLGFNISEESFNDSCSTTTVVANIMQLDYKATDDSTVIELENLTKNGKVQQILRSNGYELRGVGETDWLGIQGSIKSAGGAATADGADIFRLTLNNSFLGQLIVRDYCKEAETIINSLDELNNIEINPNSGIFTMFYICSPHHPYYLDRDGNMNASDKWFNYDGNNNESYIGALEYINKRIIPAIERIVSNDPNAIIVVCSDHGNRFGNISAGMSKRTLNIMYYKGETIEEFDGLSGVNTLIYIFNNEIGTNMSYVNLPNEN